MFVLGVLMIVDSVRVCDRTLSASTENQAAVAAPLVRPASEHLIGKERNRRDAAFIARAATC
jgi:hypothetical protein